MQDVPVEIIQNILNINIHMFLLTNLTNAIISNQFVEKSTGRLIF